MSEGLCAQVDPDLWYPEHGHYTPAKQICRVCPVRMQCLSWALDNNEEYGIWGGYTEKERRKLARIGGAALLTDPLLPL